MEQQIIFDTPQFTYRQGTEEDVSDALDILAAGYCKLEGITR